MIVFASMLQILIFCDFIIIEFKYFPGLFGISSLTHGQFRTIEVLFNFKYFRNFQDGKKANIYIIYETSSLFPDEIKK